MAFCGNCGTKAVGEFCVNCGAATVLPGSRGEEASVSEVVQAPVDALPTVTFEDFEKIQEVGLQPPATPMLEPAISEPSAEPTPIPITDPTPPEQIERVADAAARSGVTEALVESIEGDASNPEIEKQETPDDEALEAATSTKVRKPFKRGLLFIAGAFLLIGVALVPGSGNLKVVYVDQTSSNPPVGLDFEIGDKRFTVDESQARKGVVYNGSWSTFDFDQILITPSPKKDQILESSSLRFGSTGLWNLGREITVRIVVSDSTIEMRIEGPNNFFQNRVFSVSRSSYLQDYAKCESDYKANHALAVNIGRQANANYTKFLEEADLDGTRTLTYGAWAARADSLQRKLTSYINQLAGTTLPFPISVNDGKRNAVETALRNLRTAWSDFETVSRNEDEDGWDGAWTKIYERESELLNAVRDFRSSTENAKDEYCDGQLLRN